MTDFEIIVDGRTVPVRPGQTIGAALLAAGEHRLFCGIGACFGCLVTINGESSLRACQVLARPGDAVRTS